MADDLGVWLYGVTWELAPKALTELTGVGGGAVRAVTCDGLSAVVSSVSLAEFGEAALRRNFEDLDWLAATARAHDAVSRELARAGPMVAGRLATVYLGDDRVRDLLAERQAEFRRALDRLTARTEWGVKAYADPEALAAATPVGAGAGAGGAGTAYLQRRRAQLSAKQTAERLAASSAEHIHAALGELAVASQRHAPQDSQLSGTKAWMVLNGSYLVDDARTEEFAEAVRALGGQRRGIRVELTGPWPPYSFADLGEVTS